MIDHDITQIIVEKKSADEIPRSSFSRKSNDRHPLTWEAIICTECSIYLMCLVQIIV